jgi:hypothetical protein
MRRYVRWYVTFPLVVAASFFPIGCRAQRIVRVGWDAPGVPPHHYRVLVDSRVVMEMPPPVFDKSCQCLRVDVPVPPGRHVIRVEACNQANACSASVEVTTDP